jgi:hypothetical protein
MFCLFTPKNDGIIGYYGGVNYGNGHAVRG